MNAWARERRRQEIIRLCHAGHDLPTLFREMAPVLRKAIPFDAACFHTVDPATLLETSHVVENLPIENPRATELEYLYEDFNQFAALARAPRKSGILSQATGGAPERSRRYRELIRPFALHGELRAAFVTDALCWGSVGLLRRLEAGDFTPAEAAFLHEVSGYLAQGFRTALLRAAAADDAASEGPGLILLDEQQRIEAITPAAERLLAELVDSSASGAGPQALPYVVYAVASRARLAGQPGGTEALARARVRTKAGRWLILHGSLTAGEPPGRTAVIVELAQAVTIAPLIVQAYGLSERERQVMQCLLQGFSTKEIAAELYLSPYTVQEHFQAIFDKVGVRSRRELVGRVFFQHYQPRARAGAAPGPRGWFAEPAGAANSPTPRVGPIATPGHTGR
jgi:DNA-binding CsgD family transcriptional regulator